MVSDEIMKIIAVDYDDTYTELPEIFEDFMKACKSKGHVVFFVTYRHPGIDKIETSWEVFYTGGKPKAEYMRSQGLEVDIWIDDYPELIGVTH